MYKCVLENGLHWINQNGFLGLIHPEGIYDDPNGYELRQDVYQRLKYHFQFVNVKKLFQEILHWVTYSINIYSGQKDEISFVNINNLFHPSTIEACFIHNGNNICRGLKVQSANGSFDWNIEGHKSRINIIDKKVLQVFSKTFENSSRWQGAKLVSINTQEIINVIKKIGDFSGSVSDFENKISEGWHETNDVNINIVRNTKYPEIDKYEMIYSGPHIYVSNPLYKTPQEKCIIHHDFDIIDFSKIDENYVARTNYVPKTIDAGYASTIKGLENTNGIVDDWLGHYKLAFAKC